MARNVDATGNGQGWLPIIRLTTTAGTPDGAVKLNQDTIAALTDYLRKNQRESNTPDDERVQLRVLNQPAPALVSGRSLTISFLALHAVRPGRDRGGAHPGEPAPALA